MTGEPIKQKPVVLEERNLQHIAGGEDKPVVTTTLSNMENLRHEMLKAVAQNLRG